MDNHPISIKRIYEEPSEEDGYRVLVDRLWPRGVSNEDAKLDEWLKELAPSTELRKWYSHDTEKFEAIRKRYYEELNEKGKVINRLLNIAGRQMVTLLYAARDEQHNQAAVLREYLEKERES